MSTSLQTSSSTPNFQLILDTALKEYEKKTKNQLITHPLAEEIMRCDSPEAILAVLQGKTNELSQSQSSDDRLTKWLTPTVNVINALSTTLGEGVGTVFPPTKIIFSAISIFLVAARDTATSRDALIELFDRIESFFLRLQTYTEVPPTAQMTNVMGKVMAEVLCMLAIATKAMGQGRTRAFFRRLVGRNDIEDALQKLDKLEQGELRTVAAQVLKTTSDLKDDTKETRVMVQQIVSDQSSRDLERLLRDLKRWITPPDPSTNHNIACKDQHERTAAWIFNEDVFKEWELSGSLLWIHGKAGSGKSILCSAIIQHIIALRDAGSAALAYFYFDFRDVDKKHRRNLLPSLLLQLSSRLEPCLNILSRLYLTYNAGKEQPSEHALMQCLKDMLMALSLSKLPTYIVLDALDECPNVSGIPTPREHVLTLVKDLVDLGLPNLHICVTSRPEIDIRTALGHLTSGDLSLHDQTGQKKDIADYVRDVVQSDTQMKRWREDDRKLVIEKLSEKADGMFRWVFCQLEVLKHCLAPSLRRQLNELPISLDETYERVLKEIQSTNQGRHARRLLQCLVVAMRPLRVEELAEVLAFDLDGVEGEIPGFHAEWRWEDQEQAVLSACSSLIAVVDGDGSRVIQFSHFSVKEYLTSDRLAATSGDVSQYHIVPEPAHLVLVRACLGVLLNLDNLVIDEDGDDDDGDDDGESSDKKPPLLMYAAKHWASHAQVGKVSSHVKNAMKTLFDLDQPYFLSWIQIHDIDTYHDGFFMQKSRPQPLYYAALCGFYDLVRYLIAEQPEQVNDRGGSHRSPLVAALSRKHIRVAELLVKSGAGVNVRGDPPLLSAITSPDDARVDAVLFLLRHDADVNATREDFWTPLHLATWMGYLKIARMLLEYRAEIDLRGEWGETPLHLVSSGSTYGGREGERSITARLLVERGADVNAQVKDNATPLHFACYYGQIEIAQLLLDHGANAQVENVEGRSPLHEVSIGIHKLKVDPDVPYHPKMGLNIALHLLEHGADVNALDKDRLSPLHLASSSGLLEIVQLLLDHGAKANAENVRGQTPLHLVSQSEAFSCENPNVARLLLGLGMDVNAQDKDQTTPLHFACYHGNLETARVLLNYGAEANARNADGQTPLHRVLQDLGGYGHDNPAVARLLLERGVDVNARDKYQSTPLHSASDMWKLETVRVLLDHGANVNAVNVRGRTPLHMASSGRDDPWDVGSDVVLLLLKRGADVNAQDKDQATPLDLASSLVKTRIACVLFDNGAKVNIHGKNPWHLLPQKSFYYEDGERRFTQLLLERGVDVNARNEDQATPLHSASYRGNLNVAKVLLDNGAQANVEDIRGQTPLHQVVLGNHDYQTFGMDLWERKVHRVGVFSLARRLLEHGADVNAQNKDGETPLHLASRLRFLDMAQFLLEHGADVNVKNCEGKSPLELASGRKRKAMRRLLSEYSA